MAARCAALGMSRIEVSLDGEGHFLARELAVHTRERFELVLQAGGILRVQGAADKLAAIRGHAHALSCDLRREDKVFKDGTVDSRQRTAAGPGLRRTAVAGGLAHDAALTNEYDVVVRELLLELTREPLLDALEGLELGHGHKDHVGLLAALDLDLLDSAHLERTQLHLELRDVRLEINKGLADRGLDLRWRTSGRLRRTEDLLVDSGHRVSGRRHTTADVLTHPSFARQQNCKTS